jgi:hypothetical protein
MLTLVPSASRVAQNLLWSLISRNIAGQTKKSVVNTGAFIAYATGCIIGPQVRLEEVSLTDRSSADRSPTVARLQVFQAKAAPRYISAWIAHLVIYGTYILLAILLRIILMRRNALKRRAATGTDEGVRSSPLHLRSSALRTQTSSLTRDSSRPSPFCRRTRSTTAAPLPI